jgi:hypothetical protein
MTTTTATATVTASTTASPTASIHASITNILTLENQRNDLYISLTDLLTVLATASDPLRTALGPIIAGKRAEIQRLEDAISAIAATFCASAGSQRR